VQPITHFLENTPGPYYKVVQITSLSLYIYIYIYTHTYIYIYTCTI